MDRRDFFGVIAAPLLLQGRSLLTFEELGEFPELKYDGFPFRGKRDFRGWTDEDYDAFNGGLWSKVTSVDECKWWGGRGRFAAAFAKLRCLGIVCDSVRPHGQRFVEITFRFKHGIPPARYDI